MKSFASTFAFLTFIAVASGTYFLMQRVLSYLFDCPITHPVVIVLSIISAIVGAWIMAEDTHNHFNEKPSN